MRVIKGSIYVVGVDLRFGSPTFGQWQGIELTEQNHTVFYIPEGFAHGGGKNQIITTVKDEHLPSFKEFVARKRPISFD